MTSALKPLPPEPETRPGPGPLPLETGDHLDQPTFHARYEAMPEGARAELVGGVVYMPSPVSTPHSEHHAEVLIWLGGYKAVTPAVRCLDNPTLILAHDGEPQPDACLILRPESGGKTKEVGKYLAGAPELVVEVASSSASYDLHSKKLDYLRAGVAEYVVVLVEEARVAWSGWRDGQYVELPPDEGGILRSEVFPGLWLDPAALLRLDTLAVRKTLERGLAIPEYTEFVRRLRGEA